MSDAFAQGLLWAEWTFKSRLIDCSKCGERGLYSPPDKDRSLDNTLICSKCILRLSERV